MPYQAYSLVKLHEQGLWQCAVLSSSWIEGNCATWPKVHSKDFYKSVRIPAASWIIEAELQSHSDLRSMNKAYGSVQSSVLHGLRVTVLHGQKFTRRTFISPFAFQPPAGSLKLNCEVIRTYGRCHVDRINFSDDFKKAREHERKFQYTSDLETSDVTIEMG
ncbi:hypothetical protein T265_13458, partial [Opisthorchis viverrini]